MQCKLLATNKRLKQLIKEHGDTWQVLAGPSAMQCFNNEMGFRIKSLDARHYRNVLETDVVLLK